MLNQQTVLFTAHWDHLGLGPKVNGDSIYNGAEDNATGVAGMIASAIALSRAARPKRSILFVATTAEESGLLGAEAYVSSPLVPLDHTAAVLNLDVLNVRGRTHDIAALGGDRSSLGPVFATAASAESLLITAEPDLRGLFFRSDHFPFARAGVPALSFESGMDFVGRPAGWGALQDSIWTADRYHQPGDEYKPSFDLAGMAQQVRVAVRVATIVANADSLPRWHPTSEFQRTRQD
jgi:Zn-dependent M28 family amino/carboxypeptidase